MRPGPSLCACALACALTLALGASATAGEPSAQGAARGGVARPGVDWDPISYGRSRKHQMAGYSERHYGKRQWRLNPRAIVLHYTASDTYSSAWSTFESNAPALGERPGVCAHYVVDRDGTIHQLVRLRVRCRHTIGLNHVALGIEMVQPDLGNPHRTAKAILARKPQARAAVRLATWLAQRFDVKLGNVIGHGMANDSRLFRDRAGWRNDHVDWLGPQVRDFRKRMRRLRRRAGAGRAGP